MLLRGLLVSLLCHQLSCNDQGKEYFQDIIGWFNIKCFLVLLITGGAIEEDHEAGAHFSTEVYDPSGQTCLVSDLIIHAGISRGSMLFWTLYTITLWVAESYYILLQELNNFLHGLDNLIHWTSARRMIFLCFGKLLPAINNYDAPSGFKILRYFSSLSTWINAFHLLS